MLPLISFFVSLLIDDLRDCRMVPSVIMLELKRKPSLHVSLPKFGSQSHAQNGSSESLNRGPHSPGNACMEYKRLIFVCAFQLFI